MGGPARVRHVCMHVHTFQHPAACARVALRAVHPDFCSMWRLFGSSLRRQAMGPAAVAIRIFYNTLPCLQYVCNMFYTTLHISYILQYVTIFCCILLYLFAVKSAGVPRPAFRPAAPGVAPLVPPGGMPPPTMPPPPGTVAHMMVAAQAGSSE